jgi:Gas vesicle synthesis protein GvpL/GvpF
MSATAPSRKTPAAVAVYVYGITGRGAVSSFDHEGVGGEPVQVVEHDDLAALVSPVRSERLRVRKRDLVNHLGVLERAFETATVVPCAFGTMLASEDAVRRQLLIARGDELRAALRRLEGLVQMNVRVHYDEGALLREIVAGDPVLQELRERTRALGDAGYYERIRLGELVAAAVAHRRGRDEAALHDRLAPFAVEVASEPAGDDVLNSSFLVQRESLPAFDAELEAIARQQEGMLRLESIGPLPPTAFARLAEGLWAS